jgi:hypothetical protein
VSAEEAAGDRSRLALAVCWSLAIFAVLLTLVVVVPTDVSWAVIGSLVAVTALVTAALAAWTAVAGPRLVPIVCAAVGAGGGAGAAMGVVSLNTESSAGPLTVLGPLTAVWLVLAIWAVWQAGTAGFRVACILGIVAGAAGVFLLPNVAVRVAESVGNEGLAGILVFGAPGFAGITALALVVTDVVGRRTRTAPVKEVPA